MTSEQKWKWFFCGTALLLVAIALFEAYTPYIMRHHDVAAIRASIVPATGQDIAEKLLSQQEKPTILLVYASWCSTCRTVMPHFANMLRDGELQQVRFLALSIDKSDLDLFDYLVRNRYDNLFTPYILREQSGAALLGAIQQMGGRYESGIPYMAFISARGKIVQERVGGVSRQEILESLTIANK